MHPAQATPLDDIHAVGQYIAGHVAENWQTLLDARRDRLLDAYGRIGEMAYGAYLELLFRPAHRRLRQAGLSLTPRLPGDFEISREWGEEDDRQRWMWSRVDGPQGALGTIVSITHHDHTIFRLPRAPQILALDETDGDAVVVALASRSPEFASAREARVEIEEYMRSIGQS